MLSEYVKTLAQTNQVGTAYEAVTHTIMQGAASQAEAHQKANNALREYLWQAAAMGEGAK